LANFLILLLFFLDLKILPKMPVFYLFLGIFQKILIKQHISQDLLSFLDLEKS